MFRQPLLRLLGLRESLPPANSLRLGGLCLDPRYFWLIHFSRLSGSHYLLEKDCGGSDFQKLQF